MEGAVCVVFGVCIVGWGVGGECGEFLSFPLYTLGIGIGIEVGYGEWVANWAGRRL